MKLIKINWFEVSTVLKAFFQFLYLNSMKKKIVMGSSLKDLENVNIEALSPPTKQLLCSNEQVFSSMMQINRGILNRNREQNRFNLSNYTEQSFTQMVSPARNLKFSQAQKTLLSDLSQRKQIELKSKKLASRFHKKKPTQLNDVIFNQRVKKLKRNFVQKLKRNNVHAPATYGMISSQQKQGNKILNSAGIQIGQSWSIAINILFVANIIITAFIQTLSLVFRQITENNIINTIQIIGVVIYATEILLNYITVKVHLGKKLEKIREISQQYIRQNFYIDIINIFIIIINLQFSSVLNICKLFILLKFSVQLERIKKLQLYFIQNYYKEQYWSLVKVFLFNFLYAHILSIVLLSMANVNDDTNWLIVKGFVDCPWYEKYIWSYYWSTTIMLTIGFGDITPTCYQEAFVMIFIEAISCIILAYNINCVGTLINNIRAEDEEKHKSLKIFKKLAQKNKVSDELNWKINNFIQQHSNIKKITNIDDEAAFIENLPPNYKTEYLKQSNRHIFKRIYFFGSMMQKTLCALSEKIKAKITHPLQVLLSQQTNLDLLILKKGQIACKSSKNGYVKLKTLLINKLKIQDSDIPFVLHNNFITKEISAYKIVSTIYSLLYYLDYQTLVQTLRNFQKEFELYCQLRDKCKYYIDQFEVFLCRQCKSRHTEFNCPKQHFMPFKQHVIHKQLMLQKTLKNQRKTFQRKQNKNNQKFHVGVNSNSIELAIAQKQKMQSRIKQHSHIRQRLQTFKQQTKLEVSLTEKDRIHKFEKTLYDNLVQVVHEQMTCLLRQNEGTDSVWLVKSDQIKDYKNYFPTDNAQNLDVKIKSQSNSSYQDQQSIESTVQDNSKKSLGNMMSSHMQLSLMENDLKKSRLKGLVKSLKRIKPK